MKLIFKLIGLLLVLGGSAITMLGVLASLQGQDALGGVLGGGIFIALGMSVIIINKKPHSW